MSFVEVKFEEIKPGDTITVVTEIISVAFSENTQVTRTTGVVMDPPTQVYYFTSPGQTPGFHETARTVYLMLNARSMSPTPAVTLVPVPVTNNNIYYKLCDLPAAKPVETQLPELGKVNQDNGQSTVSLQLDKVSEKDQIHEIRLVVPWTTENIDIMLQGDQGKKGIADDIRLAVPWNKEDINTMLQGDQGEKSIEEEFVKSCATDVQANKLREEFLLLSGSLRKPDSASVEPSKQPNLVADDLQQGDHISLRYSCRSVTVCIVGTVWQVLKRSDSTCIIFGEENSEPSNRFHTRLDEGEYWITLLKPSTKRLGRKDIKGGQHLKITTTTNYHISGYVLMVTPDSILLQLHQDRRLISLGNDDQTILGAVEVSPPEGYRQGTRTQIYKLQLGDHVEVIRKPTNKIDTKPAPRRPNSMTGLVTHLSRHKDGPELYYYEVGILTATGMEYINDKNNNIVQLVKFDDNTAATGEVR